MTRNLRTSIFTEPRTLRTRMFENSGHGWNLREQLAGSSSAAEADTIGEQQTKRTPYHRGAELKPTHSGSSSNREPVETDAIERSN